MSTLTESPDLRAARLLKTPDCPAQLICPTIKVVPLAAPAGLDTLDQASTEGLFGGSSTPCRGVMLTTGAVSPRLGSASSVGWPLGPAATGAGPTGGCGSTGPLVFA